MALKHGAISAPTGLTLTGALIHELRTREEDVVIEAMDNQGQFDSGKSLRKKTTHVASGECSTTWSAPTVGSGTAASDDPHVDSVETTEHSRRYIDAKRRKLGHLM